MAAPAAVDTSVAQHEALAEQEVAAPRAAKSRSSGHSAHAVPVERPDASPASWRPLFRVAEGYFPYHTLGEYDA